MRKPLALSLAAALFASTAFAQVQTPLNVPVPISPANGGTGQTAYTDGQLVIGDTSTGGLDKATLTAGANVTITNGHGTISIASSGGGGLNPPSPVSTFWYMPPWQTLAAGSALTAGRPNCRLQYNPFSSFTVKTFGARITTVGSSNIQLADYATDGTGGTPGTLLGHTGDIIDTVSGLVSGAAVATFQLPAQSFYWGCVNANDSTVVLQTSAVSSSGLGASTVIGSATQSDIDSALNAGVFGVVVLTGGVYGTWSPGGTYTWSNTNTSANATVLHQEN